MAFHPPGIKGLIALQLAIDGHQHLFERLGGEAGQAVAQGVVAKRTGGPAVLLELGLSEIGLEFFEAAQAEDEAVEQRPEHRGGRDLRILAGIAERREGLSKMEDLVDIGVERWQRVAWSIVHSNNCKICNPQKQPFRIGPPFNLWVSSSARGAAVRG